MVTQIMEPPALNLKTLSVTRAAKVTQGPKVVYSSLVYRSMAEKDSAEVGAYLRATAGLGNA